MWQRRFDDLLPFAESDEGMHLHGHIPFHPISHRRAFDPQELFGQGLQHFVGRLEGCLLLAQEHRSVKLEVIIVNAIGRVEVVGPGPLQELAVCDDGAMV